MATLQLEDIYKKIPHRINEWMWNFLSISFEDILDWEFDFDIFLPTYGKNLQRPLVWTQEQKSEFLISCLKWITSWMTPFCLIEDRDNWKKAEVIDWKQRLSTLIWFLKWEIFIDINGNKYFWNDLSKECKYRISWHWIKSNIWFAYDWWTDDDKLNWFKQVNFAGTPQDKDYMNSFTK